MNILKIEHTTEFDHFNRSSDSNEKILEIKNAYGAEQWERINGKKPDLHIVLFRKDFGGEEDIFAACFLFSSSFKRCSLYRKGQRSGKPLRFKKELSVCIWTQGDLWQRHQS